MKSPFQKDGLVWSSGQGMFLFGDITLAIEQKPIFTFSFESLYCEPTLCKKVINGKDYDLTPDEIAEVQERIAQEKAKPQLVNGVDANGKFIRDVDRTEVVRVVKTEPPTDFGTMWRLDPNNLFEQWVQVFPVDKDGYLMDGIIEDSQAFDFIKTPIPNIQGVTKWKWDFLASKWIDGETYENKTKHVQEMIIGAMWSVRGKQISDIVIQYNGHTFDGSLKSLQTLIVAISVGAESIEWFPKKALEPITLSLADIKALSKIMFDEQQKIYKEYFARKKEILSIVDLKELSDYGSEKTTD